MDKQHTGTTIRQPAAAQIMIDSLDRYPNGFPTANTGVTSSSNWRTNLQNYVLNGYFTRLAITQILFQWNLPTIIAGYNDKVLIIVSTGPDAGAKILTLTGDVYYTPNELATEFEARIQAAAPSSGFAVDFVNGRFAITATEDFVVGDIGTAVSAYSRAYTTLGLQLTGGTPSQTYLSAVPTMLPTRFIDILSSYITKFQDVKDQSSTQGISFNCILARIYPVAPNTRIDISPDGGPSANPFQICIDYNTPKQIKWSPSEAMGNFDIQLRDEWGGLVPFNTTDVGAGGCEYCMTCFASEH